MSRSLKINSGLCTFTLKLLWWKQVFELQWGVSAVMSDLWTLLVLIRRRLNRAHGRPPNEVPVNKPGGGCDCREAAGSAAPLSRGEAPSIHDLSLSLQRIYEVIWHLNIAYTILFSYRSWIRLCGNEAYIIGANKLHQHNSLVCVKVEQKQCCLIDDHHRETSQQINKWVILIFWNICNNPLVWC